MFTHHKIAIALTKFYLRYGRGQSLTNFVVEIVKNIIFLGGAQFLFQKWFGILIPTTLMFVMAIVYIIVNYMIGWIDEAVGFWKFSNNYATETLTPFWKEMKDKIDIIYKKTIDS